MLKRNQAAKKISIYFFYWVLLCREPLLHQFVYSVVHWKRYWKSPPLLFFVINKGIVPRLYSAFVLFPALPFRCEEWKKGGVLCMATKYKPVAKKVRPVNEAMPQHINPPLQRPTLSRDPYETPLTMHPPEFKGTAKVTKERLEMVNFGPDGWLSEEEMKLILHVIVVREKEVAFDETERGCLNHEWGLPYVIPVVEHKPWQKREIPIPKAMKEEYVELVRERLHTGLDEQYTSSYSSPVFLFFEAEWEVTCGS